MGYGRHIVKYIKLGEIRNLRVAINMDNIDKGYSCLCFSFIMIILIYVGLRVGGYYTKTTIPEEYDYRFLIEKYMFYAGFISAQMGYSYIYGNIEEDFNKIAVISIIMFIIMDLKAIDNLLSVLIV